MRLSRHCIWLIQACLCSVVLPVQAETASVPSGTVASAEPTSDGPVRFEPWSGQSREEFQREGPRNQPPPRRDDDELLFSGGAHHGGFGAPELKLSAVLSDPALFLGAKGGWIVNHAFVLGLAGYGLATRHDVPAATRVQGQPSVLGFGYGGVRAAYLFVPHRLVHAGFGTLIGAGGLVAVSREELTSWDDGHAEHEHQTDHGDALFVLEPELEVELNVVRFMRIALGASYRYVGAVDAPGLTSKRLSAPSGSVAFKFGRF